MKMFSQKYSEIIIRVFITVFSFISFSRSYAQALDKRYFKGKTFYIDDTTLSKSSLNKDTLNLIDYPKYTYEFCESHSSSEISFCKYSKTLVLEFSKKNELNVSQFDATVRTIVFLKNMKWKWKFDRSSNTLIIYSNKNSTLKFKIGNNKKINFHSGLSPSDRTLQLIQLINYKSLSSTSANNALPTLGLDL